MLRTLLKPRYIALSALMLVVAALCVTLGSWQIARLAAKRSENTALQDNNRVAATPIQALVPLTSAGTTPTRDQIEFRHVTATGTYDASREQFVRQRIVGGDTGYYVLTPFVTDGGTVLVVRGFISGTGVGSNETVTAPPPASGTVTITGLVQLAENRPGKAAQLPVGQVEAINPTEEATRLGTGVFDAYLQLAGGQPGTDNLVALDAPDLSNPAGGAIEPQHVAYIIQWYLFAALALAAPIAMARADVKREESEIDDVVPLDAPVPATVELTPEQERARKLADRYGR